jgi:hypothetical protein
MLGWLKFKAPLQGSVWFAEPWTMRPQDVPLALEPGVTRSEPEWKEGGHWRMNLRHPRWGAVTVISVQDPPKHPAILAPFNVLTDAERAAANSVRSALYVEMPAKGANVLAERKALLQLLARIGGTRLAAAVDHTAQRLWMPADLADELAHEAALDIEGVFAVHAVMDDTSKEGEWLHTHGLKDLGGFDFHILQPRPGLVFNPSPEATRALAGSILEGRIKPNGEPFPLFARSDARFVSTREFLGGAEGHAVAVLKRAIADDALHAEIGAVLCEPDGGGLFGRLLGGGKKLRPFEALWRDGGPASGVTAFTEGMTELMGERARATYGVLRALAREFAEFAFPTGVKLRYESAGGGEHLWFRPHALSETSIDATLESAPLAIPGMKLGDRATHSIERLTDWLMATPAGYITPRSQAPARLVREKADELRAAMKKG